MPTFDLDAARKAGYTDDQIAQGLAAQQGMDYAAAVKAGYSASDMLPSLVQGITQAKPADATKPGLIEDIGTGLMSAGGKVLGALDKGAVALSDAMPDWMPGKMTPEEAAMYSARGKAAQQFANENAPQRWSGQVASGLAYAPFMGAAPLVMGGAEGTARSQLLQDQGIDAATANKAGLAEGVLQGAIGALPLGEFVTGAGGKVLAKSVASSVGKAAAAGAGQSVASDAATQAYLDANGYDEQAKQFAPSVEKAAEGALFMGAFHGGMQGAHLVAGKAFDAATGNMAPQEVPAPASAAVPNQSVVDQLRAVLDEPSTATGAVPRADLQASKEATIVQAKAADPVATADAVLAAPTIDDAMRAADSIINAPLPGLHDLADGRDVNAAIDAGADQSQTQPSTQAAADANLAGADGAFKVQPIEGQGNGIDTAGTERGTDGRGRSGEPADEVGGDLAAGRAGTGTGVIEGERDGSGLSAEKRGADAGDYRTGADGTADAQPALTQLENAHVPERPQVPEEAPVTSGAKGSPKAEASSAPAVVDRHSQLLKDLEQVGSTRAQVLEFQRDRARENLANLEAHPHLNKRDQAEEVGKLKQQIADLDAVEQRARDMDAKDARDDTSRAMLKSAKQELDASVLSGDMSEHDASTAIERARNTGNAAAATESIYSDVDKAAAPAKPEGKLAARRALNDRQDAIVKAAADKLAARKAEKEPKPEPAVMTEEQYLARNGAGRQEYGEAALHRSSERKSENTHRQQVDAQAAKDSELTARRAALRDEYHAKVASGEIRPPNAKEETIERANADPALESTQAARRIADKRGWEWRKEQAAQQPAAEAPAPDANPARAEPPLSFMKKVKVDHDVYISDERRWETVKVQAHVALKSVREDIGNLEALLKCMRG